MLALASDRRIWCALAPTDMRKSFDGLCGLVHRDFEVEPHCGDVFVFLNRRRTCVKLLMWDGNGFCIVSKRLEKGTFEELRSWNGEQVIAMSRATLLMLLEGIDTRKSKFRRHYARSVRIESGDGRVQRQGR